MSMFFESDYKKCSYKKYPNEYFKSIHGLEFCKNCNTCPWYFEEQELIKLGKKNGIDYHSICGDECDPCDGCTEEEFDDCPYQRD